ncbi:baseplate J/gp47 family protein [Cohnella silvisoli]|uniref:Baseplate J/gp47 family protein n=1 Tax=Cohnella silvisoli TaxID=2873699 RepID=A0ABV1L2Q9_9BACL|nr:baseplate J/gp47 family protein [Cohnella silvisoli]MCD9025828.1 baseplate J/gp47 family protein [Cohnella silvisoli]
MLPRLPLDDRTFESILQEARRSIPQRLPEWTDENTHDPGVTFLELFSWLSEMQQFYLSRVPERNLRKFLDLLGVSPREASSAEAEVSFGNVRESVVLPRGTKLLAEDQLFETLDRVRLLPLAIDRIVTRTEREASDRSASNTGGNVAFYAFGREAAADSRLYIAFDREPVVGEIISLHIRLAEDSNRTADIAGGKPEGVIPSARVAWKAYGWEEKHGVSWLPLRLLEDDTLHLTYSGRITFEITAPLRPVIVHPAGDRPRYWISCTLEESGYELPPRIDRLLLNTVRARQQDTKSEQALFDSNGMPGFSIEDDSFLARYGKLRVQVRESDGRWREWREIPNFDAGNADAQSTCYTVERHSGSNGPVTVRFGDGVLGTIPPQGKGNIRRIHYSEEFTSLCYIGRSNGLPYQKFQLYDLPCKWSNGLLLQVGVPEGDGGRLLWEDWEPVRDFDRSGPLDRHYVYNPSTGELKFGNDENGAIPASHEDLNLCVMSCVLGGGERGNIKPHLLNSWIQPELDELQLTADNAGYGVGGAEGESLEDCLERAQKEWQTPYCAVTNDDYVRIAKSTPGLKVARVHVIPHYAPGRGKSAPGAVTVVVVPKGLNDTPMPSPGFLATVAKHLDDRRLVTTEVHVIAPEYVQVTVHAVVVVEPHFMEEGHRIVAALNRLISPLDKPDGIQGWPFGRTVHKGDIYSAISRIKGIAYVQDLWLDAEGKSIRKSAGGDILLPDSGIIFSGDHRIELISRTQL